MTPDQNKAPFQSITLLEQACPRLAWGAGLFTAMVGAVAFLGWVLDHPVLKGVVFGGVTMKTNAAMGLMLGGLALILLARPQVGGKRQILGRLFAGLIVTIGTLTLMEHILRVDLGIDQLLFHEPPGAAATNSPNRPGPPASTALTLLGLALLLLDRRSGRVSQFLAAAAGLVLLVPLFGYAFGAGLLYLWTGVLAIALNTAVALLVLAVGVLCARPDRGILRQLMADDPGGVLLRRTIPFVLVLPFVLGWLRLLGERRGWFDATVGTSLVMLLILVTFSLLLLYNGGAITRLARERREQEERFRALVTASSDVLYRMSPDWREMRQLSGGNFIPNTESPSPTWLEQYIPPEDQPQVTAAIQQAIRSKGIFQLEHRVRRVDGSIGWTFSRAIPLLDAKGEIVEWFGTASDITERKWAEEALRESEQRFRTMVDAIAQLAWMARPDGHIFFYNRRWYEYTGTTPEQMEGWGWQSVHDPNLLPKVLERWKAAIATGEPFEMEFPLRRADGQFQAFLTRAQPLKDSQGRVVLWFGTNTDIHEQKQAQESLRRFSEELEQRVAERTGQLQAAVEELRRSNEDLERFAYISSHDLQEPVRMVGIYTGMLAHKYKDKLDADARQYIDFAVEGAVRMSNLIKDLLTYSQITSQSRPPVPTDTGAVVREVLETLRLRILETGAQVTFDGLPMVLADPVQITQVFQNLIENAIKYRKDTESPRVHVSAEQQKDGQWLFKVRDNGIGIDPQHHEQVFVAFKRLHANRAKYPGTGIGLAIVKRIVERHGGRVYIDSQPGKGSTFYFTLPVHDQGREKEA